MKVILGQNFVARGHFPEAFEQGARRLSLTAGTTITLLMITRRFFNYLTFNLLLQAVKGILGILCVLARHLAGSYSAEGYSGAGLALLGVANYSGTVVIASCCVWPGR